MTEAEDAKGHLRAIEREMRDLSARFLLDGLSQLAAVSASALALLVTFRGVLLGGHPEQVWMVKVAWVGLGVALVAAVWCKLLAADALSSGLKEKQSSEATKRKASAVSLLSSVSLCAFVLGILGLTAFGLANL